MSLQRCNVSDLFTLSKRELTSDGFLKAPAKMARSGNVQVYQARELGLDGGSKIVRLYRPADEVGNAETLASFDGVPITVGHPKEGVHAKNWRSVAVGEARGPAFDGTFMDGALTIRDHNAIATVMDGKTQLSCGYEFDYDPTPGKTADGVEYDGVQRRIRGNHVAIVDVARGGPSLRIADSNQRTGATTMRTLTIDGVNIKDVEDTAASLIEKIVGDAKKSENEAITAFAAADSRAKSAEEALAAEKAATAKLVADHAVALAASDAKILKPEAIEALAIERSKVCADALVLVPEFKAEGKTVPAIRAEVLGLAMAKDEKVKAIATAVIGDADMTKPESATVIAQAFGAVVALGAKDAVKPAHADDATKARDAALSAALLRGGAPASAGPSARELFKSNMRRGFAAASK